MSKESVLTREPATETQLKEIKRMMCSNAAL